MSVYLFNDKDIKTQLLPLTFLRHTAEVRTGILTIWEKWSMQLGKEVELVENLHPGSNALYINGALCPDANIINQILNLEENTSLVSNGTTLAGRGKSFSTKSIEVGKGEINLIDRPWKIFQYNAEEIKKDFIKITENRTSAKITDPFTAVYSPENLFIEEGVSIKAAVIDATNGPVYLGKNTTIKPGAVINGSFALLDHSTVGTGANMRGDSTIGPWSKVAGEITNSVIFGYSNKGHSGYLGNSVIAEWCNLGADTNTSNMKNDYSEVRLWDYAARRFIYSGLQFCGLMMGDHSKCGINTMFNTGTSVGVGCNLFGAGYHKNFIPSFFMGSPGNYSSVSEEVVIEIAEKVMERRNKKITEEQVKKLYDINRD